MSREYVLGCKFILPVGGGEPKMTKMSESELIPSGLQCLVRCTFHLLRSASAKILKPKSKPSENLLI